MKLVIDSSVYVSHFGQEDGFTERSKLFFEKLADFNPKIIVPTLVAAETLVILTKQHHTDLRRIYKWLTDLQMVNLDRESLNSLMRELHNEEPKFKTSDYLIALAAKQQSATLVTWDKQLLTQAKDVCAVCTPEEFVGKEQGIE